jgi:NADH-quinone oxidoreductase subunit E
MLADLADRARDIIARYPEGRSRSALLPMLHLVHAEQGCVSAEGIAFCADMLGLTRAEVSAVATFYTMYKRRPAGDWLVSVCTNTMCDVLGGRQVYEMLSEYLDVGHDETTADGTITLEHAECLAACDYGPVMTVNYEFFDKVDVESALGIVTALQGGERPRPSRGARLCTLKEMSVQLAGFANGAESWEATGVADGVAGDPTLRTNILAERHGISVADFDPDTPIGRPDSAPGPATPGPAAAPEANKPASDGKPAGDSPLPQRDNLKEAGA